MKIKTDTDELEVPKELEKYFKKDKNEEDESESCWEIFKEFEGKITTKKIAYFVSSWYTTTIPGEGGYNIWNMLDFEIEGYEYGVIAFGWSSEMDDKGPIYMIGYKEKIKEEKQNGNKVKNDKPNKTR